MPPALDMSRAHVRGFLFEPFPLFFRTRLVSGFVSMQPLLAPVLASLRGPGSAVQLGAHLASPHLLTLLIHMET